MPPTSAAARGWRASATWCSASTRWDRASALTIPGRTPSRSRLGADEEHTFPGRQMLLKGITSTRLQTWDAVRSLDYLASHPLVDPKRLAATGQSGGGTNTMLLAAVDDRLAAAVVSCGITENVACANFNPPGSTDDASRTWLRRLRSGFDRWDLLYPLAPKPLLVLVSERDFFGTYSPNYISSGTEEFQKLQRVYDTGPCRPHRLVRHAAAPRLQSRYAHADLQLVRALAEGRRPNPSPKSRSVQAETEETLFVSANGSVVQSFHGETPFTLNRKRTLSKTPADLATAPACRPASAAPERHHGRPRLLPPDPGRGSGVPRRAEGVGAGLAVPAQGSRPFESRWSSCSNPAAGLRGTKRTLRPAGGGRLHRLRSRPARHRRHHAGVRPRRRAPRPAAQQRRGLRLVRADSRQAAGRPARHRHSRHRSRSAIAPEFARRRVILAARGILTVPALFAAALEPAIDSLYLADGLISFRSIVETEVYKYPFGNFVPNLLAHTDLPELTASLAPRRVTLAGAIDGAGNRMSVDAVRAAVSSASNIRVLPEPAWTPSDILSAREII